LAKIAAIESPKPLQNPTGPESPKPSIGGWPQATALRPPATSELP